jgi:hypothetical protein
MGVKYKHERNDNVNWFELAQNWNDWWALVNTAINF